MLPSRIAASGSRRGRLEDALQGSNPRPSAHRAKGQWFEHQQTACKEAKVHRCRGAPAAGPRRPVPIGCPATQAHQPTADTKKTCKCRPFAKRLKGFEPSTFCMASSSSTPEIVAKCLQISRYHGVSPRMGLPRIAPKYQGF